MASESGSGSIRLGSIEGYSEKKNEVIYHPPSCAHHTGCVVFFGGDVQDYKENMLAHRDNKCHVKWDLESTAVLLHSRFPDQVIIIIKPVKMTLMTFSCYENFSDVNNFGAPTYVPTIDSLKHLKCLLQNIDSTLLCYDKKNLETDNGYSLSSNQKILDGPITLIGFSKGCLVLNQFLYSFLALKSEKDSELVSFVSKIKSMYWLDGGHSGSSSTWVTDKSVLGHFASLNIGIHIHVTPYQVMCDTRPRIGKEEKIFRETLCRLGVDVRRRLHFEDEVRSLEMHFKVLEVFEKPQ